VSGEGWTGQRVVAGKARGPALKARDPISFLGDIDIRTGRVVGGASDIRGSLVTGRVLVVPTTRGSAGAWRFLFQLHQHGTNPLALVTQDLPDPSVVQGAIMCDIPVVAGVARALLPILEAGDTLAVDGEAARVDRVAAAG
jgi:predicted aconitase with swiveling domain